MNEYTAQRLVMAASAVSLLAGCARTGSKSLPICVVDERTQGNRGELRRHTITPVEEYFDTLGRPSRPVLVWRCYLDAGMRQVLWEDSAISRTWKSSGATNGVAVTLHPPRVTTNAADPRLLSFPLCKEDNPAGTETLIVRVEDTGLQLEPSPIKLKKTKGE